MLCSDVIVVQAYGLAQAHLQYLLGSWGERNVVARTRRGEAFADDLPYPFPQRCQDHTVFGKNTCGYPFLLIHQCEQQMLSSDVAVVEPPSFFLGEHHHSSGPIGETLEHRPDPTLFSISQTPAMESIRSEISSHGPIPFERFMELALYGPGGFFTSVNLRSVKSGDFLTSPEVSSLFGQTLARFVEAERARVGEPFVLVEAGAGSGSLLRPLVEIVEVETWAVEISPPAASALAELVGPNRVVGSLDQLPRPFTGVVIANELLDNLPMAIAQLTDHGWRERWVGADGDGLTFVDAPVRSEVEAWLNSFAGPVEVGGWVEVQLQACHWIGEALALIEHGTLVVIDYGDTADNLAPRRRDGTLRTYRSHHLGPHPLDEPGATDITADVNFTAMTSAAEGAGAGVELHRQDDFLTAWGLRERLSQLRSEELALARAGDDQRRLRVRSLKTEAETLLHPRGLGDFRVLTATKRSREHSHPA